MAVAAVNDVGQLPDHGLDVAVRQALSSMIPEATLQPGSHPEEFSDLLIFAHRPVPTDTPYVKTFPVSWEELHRHSKALAWRDMLELKQRMDAAIGKRKADAVEAG